MVYLDVKNVILAATTGQLKPPGDLICLRQFRSGGVHFSPVQFDAVTQNSRFTLITPDNNLSEIIGAYGSNLKFYSDSHMNPFADDRVLAILLRGIGHLPFYSSLQMALAENNDGLKCLVVNRYPLKALDIYVVDSDKIFLPESFFRVFKQEAELLTNLLATNKKFSPLGIIYEYAQDSIPNRMMLSYELYLPFYKIKRADGNDQVRDVRDIVAEDFRYRRQPTHSQLLFVHNAKNDVHLRLSDQRQGLFYTDNFPPALLYLISVIFSNIDSSYINDGHDLNVIKNTLLSPERVERLSNISESDITQALDEIDGHIAKFVRPKALLRNIYTNKIKEQIASAEKMLKAYIAQVKGRISV